MTLCFKNTSKYAAVVCIAGKNLKIPPRETISAAYDGDELEVEVSVGKETRIKGDVLHISLVTNYRFTHLSEYCEFTMTREKIRFSYNATYERLFLDTANAVCLSE